MTTKLDRVVDYIERIHNFSPRKLSRLLITSRHPEDL